MRGCSWCLAVALAGCGGTDHEPSSAEPTPVQPQIAEPEPEPEPEPIVAPITTIDVDEVAPIPPTDLSLLLMATMVAEDPKRGRATVRNPERDVIATYAIGDAVAPGAVMVEVQRDYLVLERDGSRERLDFPIEPKPLSGAETFYLDLVDLDARTNSMDDAIQLVDGPGYIVKNPAHAWGTPRTVAAIGSASMSYLKRGLDGPSIHVGDISKEIGGPFPPHLSHQDGRDVDVGYVLSGEWADKTRFITATTSRLDIVRTWALIESFMETDRVRYMFVDYGLQRLLYEYAKSQGEDSARLDAWFQYPAGSSASRGVIRHWRGHANHFHVRFQR